MLFFLFVEAIYVSYIVIYIYSMYSHICMYRENKNCEDVTIWNLIINTASLTHTNVNGHYPSHVVITLRNPSLILTSVLVACVCS